MSATCKTHPDRKTYGDTEVCLPCFRARLAASGEAEQARVANANETARLPLVKLRKLAAARGHDIDDTATVDDLVEIITGARPTPTPTPTPADEAEAAAADPDAPPADPAADPPAPAARPVKPAKP